MTSRALVLTACIVAVAAGSALAQQPPSTPSPAPRAGAPAPPAAPVPAIAPAPPRREGQPVNIKIDVTITDQRTGSAPVKKTVSVVTGDSMSGFIRTSASYQVGALTDALPLNIDAEPTLIADTKIRLRLNLQYDLPMLEPAPSDSPPRPRKTQIHENLGLILENGKSMVVAQSADPVTDRQVTVEVKATILR